MKNITKNNSAHVARRKSDTGERKVRKYRLLKAQTSASSPDKLRVIPLGGQNGIGAKNMIVLEYGNDAIILDCGFELGINLPGINYAIPVTDYLQSIRHKIRGYVISHGHMDHIGGLIHIFPQYPAPIFGSRFTIGMVEAQFEKLENRDIAIKPVCTVMNMDEHEQIQLGVFTIELLRVTHSIPESSAIVIGTPVGRVINTGDFRLDPEPLDARPSDVRRLQQLGDEGVTLLMSESTNTTKLGRTPAEHTLQDSFHELIGRTKGRLIVAVFSTNMNRVQMIVNAAHAAGRKIALDGRSMVTVAELAVRLGNLKVPKGTFVSMSQVPNVPDAQLVVICTGGQGEPGAALSRMAAGEHKYLKLKPSDSVVISSTPIPGNEQSYQQIGDDLASIGVIQFRHPTHQIDGSGPLHVSGHGARDEHAEMIQLTRPKYLMPIYGGALNRKYHKDIGIQQGIAQECIIMAEDGMVIELSKHELPKIVGQVTSGSLLVDQTGTVVPEIVTMDRLLLQDDGFVVVIVTLDRATGRLLASPDIITRGHVAIRDNPGIVDGLRLELRKFCATRKRVLSRNDIDTLKRDIKDVSSGYLFNCTSKTPMVIPVVNTVSVNGKSNVIARPIAEICS